jgi:glucose-6-phosphate 1-epimerase
MDIVDDKVCFLLDNTAIGEEYAKAFPYSFALKYQLELSAEGVKTTLFVENKGDTAFEFQSLLHTYYNVDAIAAATFTGFKDYAFVDKLTDGDDEPSESRDVVTIGEETDRIYRAVKSGPYVIGGVTQSGGTAVSIEISTPDDAIDCVLWNPWIAKAAKMGDFGDDEYLNMVCVEPGFVAGPKTLAPGGTWFLGVESKAAKL